MVAAIAISWQSRRPPTRAPAALLDAGPPPADASADAAIAPLDAGLTLDAAAAPLRRDAGATVLPIDAGRPARPPRRLPSSRTEIDAGSELDFYRSDAGP